VLSFIGRLFFRTPIRDFHCGLRAFTRAAYDRMATKTIGMECASEMVMKASIFGMRVAEVPITLHKDGRSRPPHLKPWRDGWRHLRFMLIYSPRWLFLVPGLVLATLSLPVSMAIFFAPRHLGAIQIDAGSLAVTCMLFIIGVQLVAFAFFAKVFAIGEGLLPDDPRFSRAFRYFSLEKGLIVGTLTLLAGAGLLASSIWAWKATGFGNIPYSENLRRIIAAVTLIIVGHQVTAASWFLSVLGLKTTSRRPPEPQPGGSAR
jgi:hypothetical protein